MIKFSVCNLGPIWEATIDLSKFNLISGKNATGKSFFVRLLHAIIVAAIQNKRGEDLEKTLAKKIRWVFQQKDISAIVNRITGGDLYTRVTIDNKTFLTFSISRFTRIKINGGWSGKITLRQNVKEIEIPYRNCLFISSPYILDTELALANYRCYRNNLGVSDVFWDILCAIRTVGVADEIELKSVYKKIEKTIGGKFYYKTGQGVVFKEKERGYDVKITASGIKIFGILQLLIERNLLAKDSFLVIEEPECNLHPVYIFKFIEILSELTKQGVYIVVVTHSGEIICYTKHLVKTKNLLSSDICFSLFKKENGLAFVRTGNDLSILTEMLEDLRRSKDESTT